jgi:hypothetical protein
MLAKYGNITLTLERSWDRAAAADFLYTNKGKTGAKLMF